MKSLPIALDRLLSNPSFERVDGKLIKAADDGSRIIIELKGKKLRTLLGPFPETDWHVLADKVIVAFVKQGEVTRVFDAKLIPKEQRASTAKPAAAGATKRGSSKPKAEVGYTPKVKWKKYAESRMIGEPVRLTNMEKGFGFDLEFIHKILNHLGIAYLPITKSIAYLDFRKVYHFLSDPSFRAFQSGYVPGTTPIPMTQPTTNGDVDDEDE